jgi:hypothetical protein
MANALANLTVAQLKRAVEIKERVKALESQLGEMLRTPSEAAEDRAARRGPKGMGAAGRARIGAAQRTRWARQKRFTVAPEPAPKARKKRRKITPAGRARLAAAAKARWARVRAAGKTSL